MMGGQLYRQQVIEMIDDYLRGVKSNYEVSKWALDIIISDDWERLPKEITNAMHLLFDLHDVGKPWCPNIEELTRTKKALEETR